ncbi:transposase [Streptomyces mirabilis]
MAWWRTVRLGQHDVATVIPNFRPTSCHRPGASGRVFKRSRVVDHGRVIRRHELTDAEWEFVGPLLPVSLRGRKRLDDRKVLNGIVWKFRTGTAWRDTGASSTRLRCVRPPA